MAPRTKVSFASLNLYNINTPNQPVYSDKNGWSEAEYAKKVEWTSFMLAGVASDVWGFQELWTKKALEDVFDAAGLLGGYELLVPPDHSGKSIVCAGAVKKGLLAEQPRWIRDFPPGFKLQSGGDDPQTSSISVSLDTFSRPILHFKVRPRERGDAISVYVVHFKSKGPAKIYYEKWYKADKAFYSRHSSSLGAAISTIRRTAEAAALRMILTEEMKGTGEPVLVMGDCNDGQHSNTLNILTEQPNYLLSGFSLGGSDTALYTAGTLQEYRSLRDVYYTHIHNNVRESLDHILVSQEFYDNSRSRQWAFMGMELFNDHLNTEEHKQNGSSDHGIVKATFEYRPAAKEK